MRHSRPSAEVVRLQAAKVLASSRAPQRMGECENAAAIARAGVREGPWGKQGCSRERRVGRDSG